MGAQESFAGRLGLPYPLLDDSDGRIARAYGVAGGVLRAGLSKRQTFLIGADGRVLRRFRSVRPSTHAREVLDALRS